MWHAITSPWPWYVAGPLLGLFVPLLLVLGNRQLGLSGSLRAICAAVAPGRVDFFRYDWKAHGLWNVAFAAGMIVGAAIAARLTTATTPAIAPATAAVLTDLGLNGVSGLVPEQIFNWSALLTWRGFACMIGGGFLVGFGSSYAGGCTSGHGIMGLATRQLASVIALCAIFAGGLVATFILLPAIF